MKNILSKYALVVAIYVAFQAVEAQEISSFTLINAEENIEIGTLSDGDSIYIPDQNTEEFSVRANVTGQIGSIVFKLDEEIVGADNSSPYALLGNPGNNYTSWRPEMRTYTITGSAYSLPQGQGTLLDTYSIATTFVDVITAEPIGPDVNSLVLINADTDEDIAEINEGSVFILEEIGTNNLNIRAEVGPGTESVLFGYQDNDGYHIENLPKYAIGANDDDDYRPWIPEVGVNTVTATAFNQDRAKGNAGNPLTVNFAIFEEDPDNKPKLPFSLRINSGGPTVVHNDTIYVADTLYVGNGKPFNNYRIADILETEKDSIYKTERTSNGSPTSFGYAIPVANGAYDIKLHFAEIYWGATGGGLGGESKRIFSVLIEGEKVIEQYDLSLEKDPMTAIVKTFNTIVVDGELNIDFSASVNQPKISALEVYGINSGVSDNLCDWETLHDSTATLIGPEGIKLGEKMYVFGSTLNDSTSTSALEIYDTKTNTWSQGTPMPNAIYQTAKVVVGNEIWLMGGIINDSLESTTNSIYIYDTNIDSWHEGLSLPEARVHGAAVYSQGKIHFLGGLSPKSKSEVDTHFVYNLNDSLPQWEIASPLPDARSHLALTELNGKIYAIGGQRHQDSVVQTTMLLHEYDALKDSWLQKADLPIPLSHIQSSTVIHNNRIIVVGGKSGGKLVDTITEYDPETNSWTKGCRLPEEYENPSVAVFGDLMIVMDNEGNGMISMQLESETEIPVEPEKQVSVLVYHETKGFRHNSIEAGIEMVREFGEELDWKVSVSETSNIFQIDSLETFDVVIWLNTTGEDLLTLEEQKAFEGFIQNGGGFVGVHSATDTYRNGSWSWYNDLVGAIVQVNPYHTANNTNATIDVVGNHSAVEHLGSEWNKNEEYYYWERNGGYLFEGNIDLLRVRQTGANSYDAARPVTWYKEYDGGRSFYTALGHNASDYQSNEKFRIMLKEAILWASENEGKATDEEMLTEEPIEIEPPIEENIELFPNPVVDVLNISTNLFNDGTKGEIAIFGLDGILMKKKRIDLYDSQIELGDLTTGYYAVSVQIGSVTERVLIYKQ